MMKGEKKPNSTLGRFDVDCDSTKHFKLLGNSNSYFIELKSFSLGWLQRHLRILIQGHHVM